jgi:hypothetical protein
MTNRISPLPAAWARPGWTALAFVVWASSALSGGAARGQTFSNPLNIQSSGFGADGPADPCVVEYLGTYYLYPTGNSQDYRVMLSEDLVSWRGGAIAFAVPSGSPWKDGWLWAPEVQRINGRFYLYYSAGNANGLHVGVADCDTPEGPFTDRSYGAPLISASSIDACCLLDGTNLYLYYASGGSVWVRKLLDPLTVDTSVSARRCITPDVPWEGSVNEGPYVIKRGGIYYMLYSGNGADTANYGVGTAWAVQPRGPWTKQPGPYNPVFSRNDAIGLWGPGHGSPVIGPDGVSDWYAYHHKISSANGWPRLLALDRIVAVPRVTGSGLAWTSSGGTTQPTPAPRLAFASANFRNGALPAAFHFQSGSWGPLGEALLAPADGVLRVQRPLMPENLQDFQFEWWLRTVAAPSDASCLEFGLGTTLDGRPARAGFRIRPAQHTVVFGTVMADTGGTTDLAVANLGADFDWGIYYRRVTLSKNGTRWTFLIDRQPVLTADFTASLAHEACVRTTSMPVLLDGYRQTIVFADDFECTACTQGNWSDQSGTWAVTADAYGNHLLRQSDLAGGWKVRLCDGPALEQFDLQADFHLLTQITGNGLFPKHGLIHNYVDAGNYCMVFIDDQYAVLATAAFVQGAFASWINAPGPMPATFSGGEFRHLAVTTDTGTGDFVYSLDGHEMLRRAYPGLPAAGRAGLIVELSDVEIDNFRFSGTAAPTLQADFDVDGDVDQSDFGHLQACLTGAPLGPDDAACADADLDGNGWIDSSDVALFAACKNGAGISADPACGPR